MKRRLLVVASAALAVAVAAPLSAQMGAGMSPPGGEPVAAAEPAPAMQMTDFDRLRTLEGQWVAKPPAGPPSYLDFEKVSNGNAVFEHLRLGGDDMVTMYHQDGESVRLTHFCGGGNQPRMKQVKSFAADGELRFAFIDVTNLKSPLDGHMREIAYVFHDEAHFTQKLRWREAGQEVEMVLEYERVK